MLLYIKRSWIGANKHSPKNFNSENDLHVVINKCTLYMVITLNCCLNKKRISPPVKVSGRQKFKWKSLSLTNWIFLALVVFWNTNSFINISFIFQPLSASVWLNTPWTTEPCHPDNERFPLRKILSGFSCRLCDFLVALAAYIIVLKRSNSGLFLNKLMALFDDFLASWRQVRYHFYKKCEQLRTEVMYLLSFLTLSVIRNLPFCFRRFLLKA